ncbi:MAG: arsenite methyltransferase [Chloroflexota bacterium]
MPRNAEEIKSFVKERYGKVARSKSQSCCGNSCSCQAPTHAEKLYSGEELKDLPKDVTDVSLGCGNPTAIAELKAGETVLDLGSGGGIDCFLAAQKVGAKGRVIGLDMTSDMIQLARRNVQKMGVKNVEFRLGEMEHMPVPDGSVDAIISNCVVNLSPDKDAVFGEAYRVLKPGGRLCISDIVLLGELPREVKESLEQWAGCIAGALPEDEYLAKIRAAGFTRVTVQRSPLPFYSENDAPKELNPKEVKTYLDLRGKIVSARVRAVKPAKVRNGGKKP